MGDRGRRVGGGLNAQSSPPLHWSRAESWAGEGLSGGASPSPRPTWPCPQFDPELVLVAAGFDSAIGDPEVRARPGWEGFSSGVLQPGPVIPALVPGADAGHARVLRPPHTAAAGAGWWPGLRCAGGDYSEQGGPTGQRLRCCLRGLPPNNTPAPVTPLPSSLLPGWLPPGVALPVSVHDGAGPAG